MNKLYIGMEKEIELPKGGFLLIDDEVRKIPRARVFDPLKHSFNPLKDIDYKKAREIADILYTIAPEGENTLTVRNGKRSLLKLLLEKPPYLDKIAVGRKADPGMIEAHDTVWDILQSPVLNRVLCNPTNFSFNPRSVILARVNRAELGEFDALFLGLFLMLQFKGQIVVPDFGFYGREAHASLIREERLIAGVNFLSELPPNLRRRALLIENKMPMGATYEDAELLAKYRGLRPDRLREDNEFNRFVDDAMDAGA